MRKRPTLLAEDEAAERAMIEEARAMQSWEKMQRVEELTKIRRQQIMAELREKYQSASEEELRMRFAVAVLGPELAKEVYGVEFND